MMIIMCFDHQPRTAPTDGGHISAKRGEKSQFLIIIISRKVISSSSFSEVHVLYSPSPVS